MKIISTVLFFSLIIFQKAFASSLPPVVVKAKKISFEPISTSHISKETLEKKQQNTVFDAIKDLPGVHAIQQGGSGKSARVYVRGGRPEHTLVLIDGMRGNDPASPESAFDFGHLTVEGAEQIEVLKGPYSAQYGSEAAAGVVNIATSKGKGKTKLTGTVEAGSFQTHRQQASIQGEKNNIDFNVNVNHFQTNGIVTAPQANRTLPRQWNTDPYNSNAVSSRVGALVNPDWHISMWNRYKKYRSRYGDHTTPAAPSYQDLGHQSLHRLQVEGDLANDKWKPTIGVGYLGQERKSENDIVPVSNKANFRGDTIKFDWNNQVKVTDIYTIHMGIEKEKQSYQSVTLRDLKAEARADEKSAFMGNIIELHPRWKIEGWGRYHRHSRFGGHPSYRTVLHYHHFETATRFFTAWGTAIKAPSLFQLFDRTSGNRDLKPEKLRSYEIGGDQQLVPNKISIGTIFFRTLATQMISFKHLGNDRYSYRNIGSAEMRGWESFIKVLIQEGIKFRCDYTYLRAKDLNENLQLTRRPLHKFSATVDLELTEKWEMSFGASHTGKQADILRFVSPGNRVYKGGVTTARAATTYHLNKSCDLFGRIENALNRHYEQPSGYMQPGLAIYVGAKITT